MQGDEGFIFDGLNLNDSAGPLILEGELGFTPAQKKPTWAENPAADGDLLTEEPHYTNSGFAPRIRFLGDDMDEALALMGQLTDKLQKAARMADRGGIPLLWTPADLSTSYTWWALLGEFTEIPITPTGDLAGWFIAKPIVGFKLTCRPFGYRPERVVVAPVASALPVQTVLIPDVGGDVAAEARAIVTDKAGQDRRHLEWGLDQVDGEQATNLITNPKGGIDTTSWAGVSLAAGPTRILPEFPLADINADTAVQAQTNADADYLYHTVAVTNGTTYRFSVYVQLTALTAASVRPVVYNAAGAVKKATGAAVLSTIDADGWVRLDVSFKADATASWRVGVEQVGAGAATFALTGAMVEASANLTPYFDGDVAHAAWTGTRHASTSLRLADTLILAAKLVTAGFAGAATTRTGAYSEEKVVRATAVSGPVTLCSTGNVAYVGAFKGKPRIYATSFDARIRVSYRVGDGPFYPLPWKAPPVINAWTEVDVGEATLDRLLRGPQRAEVRLEIKSVGANTPIDVNYLNLLPTTKGWGKARGLSSDDATNLLAYDEFDLTSGNLDAPKALPLGGNWSEVNKTGANGFVVNSTSHVAERAKVSDADWKSGCFALAGVTEYTSVQPRVDVTTGNASGNFGAFGVLARYVNLENWIMGLLWSNKGEGYLLVKKCVAGVVSELAFALLFGPFAESTGFKHTVQLKVGADGTWQASAYAIGGTVPLAVRSGQDADLATGGALAKGKVGMYDAWAVASANTRTFDKFSVMTPNETGRVCYASRSLEIRSDDTLRQDANGINWGPPSFVRDSRLWIPPEGDSGQVARLIAKLRRLDTDVEADSNVTDNQEISVRIAERVLVPR